MKYKYLFGPVPSRRLGVSLGIDLIPFKTCTFDCVYCECGPTTNLTIDRKEYLPTYEIIHELKDYLSQKPKLDYITFSGSGEPLLHNKIGEIIEYLKDNFPSYKIAILTNGSLLNQKSIINEIIDSDLIMPSLDAASEEIFQKINRPSKKIELTNIVSGLIKLRKKFEKKIWLEVFIVPGLNDSSQELKLLHNAIEKIKPDKIQINSLDRPGTENWVESINDKIIEKVKGIFRELPLFLISNYKPRKDIESFSINIKDKILSTISRRPCTAKDLSESLGLHIDEVTKYLQSLLEERKINYLVLQRGKFYKIN